MLPLLFALLATARSSLKSQREPALQSLAARQQLAILKRKTKRPKLNNADRAFWVTLCHRWPEWQSALLLVKYETVIGWHRKGFKLYWTWQKPITVPSHMRATRRASGARRGLVWDRMEA
jgi:hypothetical protein